MFKRLVFVMLSEAAALGCLFLLIAGNSDQASGAKVLAAAVGVAMFGFAIPIALIRK